MTETTATEQMAGDSIAGEMAGKGMSQQKGTLPAVTPAGDAQKGGAVQQEVKSLLPSTSSLVQASAFGAALGGMTTGVMEMARVKKGEVTTDQAVKNIASASAQGAATMAVATVASQVVRSHPVFGFVALAAAGLGAFVLLSGGDRKPVAPANGTQGPDARGKPSV